MILASIPVQADMLSLQQCLSDSVACKNHVFCTTKTVYSSDEFLISFKIAILQFYRTNWVGFVSTICEILESVSRISFSSTIEDSVPAALSISRMT